MSSLISSDALFAEVDEVCDRLSAALGWRIDFDAGNEESLGQLRLKPTSTSSPRTELPVAMATAQAVSVLLTRLRSALTALESRSREVMTLMNLGRPDQKPQGLSTSLERFLAAAVELTGFWSSALFLIDPVTESLRLRSTWRIDPKQIPRSCRSLRMPTPDAQSLLHGAVLLDRNTHGGTEWLPEGCATALGVPVRVADGPLGMLWCFERRRHTARTHDVNALKSVATQIARALEHASLLRESAARKRIHSELRTASRHQNNNRSLPVRANPGIDIAMRVASASELSGDLCEVCPLDASRTLIALGDAVGHSIPAAMVMSVARGALRALVHDDDPDDGQPSKLISRINRTLCSSTSAEQFMSVVAGIIDHRRQLLTYSNAGHPPPLLIRRGVHSTLNSHGMLCGILAGTTYQQSEVPLEAGDLLVLFTDGVTEALSPQRQLFRAEGIITALANQSWESADAAANAIWQRLNQHTGHRDAADDQTLLVIHVGGQRVD